MSREIWRDVPTWEGFYQASSHGRLRRVGRRALKLNMSKRGHTMDRLESFVSGTKGKRLTYKALIQ